MFSSANTTPSNTPHSSMRRLSTNTSFIFGSSRPLIDKHLAINDKYMDPDASMRLRYQVASVFIDDAINKRRTETRVINTKAGEAETALKAFFIVHNSWWRRFVWLCIIVQLSLAFLERPSFHAPQDINERYIAIVELFCVLVYILDMVARMLTVGYENFLKSLWNVIKLFVVIAMLLDITIILMVPQSLHFSRILRSYILLEKSRTVRNVTWNIIRSIPKMFPVFGMMLALIVFYAILATILFVREDDPNFKNLLESTVSMFILTTTENFPDVMLPEYKRSAWNTLFFISFLLITQLFFVNLVVAVFYQTYQEHVIQNIKQDLVFRKESLTKAFELMKNSEGSIDFETFRNVFSYLKYNFTEHNVQFIYHMLDKDHDQSLNLTEFLFLCDVMKFTFEEIEEVIEEDTTTLTYKLRYFLEVITASRVWKGFVDLVIVISTVEVIAEVHKCQGKCPELLWVEYMLGFFFIAEVGIRIFAFGAKQFFRKQWNKFDFLLCMVSLIWLTIVRPSFDSWAPGETMLVIRVLFCLRVMSTAKKLDIFVSTILQLIPAMTCFVTVLLSIFYLYAILGMELFWNVITKDNPVYGDSNPDYYLINFNNMHYALITLYVLMTVNNWNTFMAGTVAATSKWARLYFISFYLLTVLIVLNVIIAFVIETFVEQQAAMSQTKPSTLPSNINGAIADEEIQERIHIAARRATRAVRMKVQPKRDLNALHEGLLKDNLDTLP